MYISKEQRIRQFRRRKGLEAGETTAEKFEIYGLYAASGILLLAFLAGNIAR